jgi:hypothetical protein
MGVPVLSGLELQTRCGTSGNMNCNCQLEVGLSVVQTKTSGLRWNLQLSGVPHEPPACFLKPLVRGERERKKRKGGRKKRETEEVEKPNLNA